MKLSRPAPRELLALSLLWTLIASRPAYSATVAYVDSLSSDTVKYHVVRAGRTIGIVARNVDLEPFDRIYFDTRDAMIFVRYIADDSIAVVKPKIHKKDADEPDYTVMQSSLPGLKGVVLAWLETELSGADRGGGAFTATRGVSSASTCFNEGGRTDDPTSFNVPILRAKRSRIAAGERSIFVSWRGGAAPYEVSLANADTGESVATAKDIKGACWTRLPDSRLDVGHYRLKVMDANSAVEEETNLFVVDAVPLMPEPLAEAQLPDEVRNLYYATWLSTKDGGEWAFEAQQLVAQMDCRSSAVQQWLRRWGDAPVCH